jgi:hypothetical protein
VKDILYLTEFYQDVYLIFLEFSKFIMHERKYVCIIYFYFYATTVNILVGVYTLLIYSHGAYDLYNVIINFLFSFLKCNANAEK